MAFHFSFQATKLGAHTILKGNLLALAIFIGAFGCISFIPHHSQVMYTVSCFGLRVGTGVVASAIFVATQVAVTEAVPSSRTLLLVGIVDYIF